MVRCSDGSLYTGIAKLIEPRIAQHNAGTGAKYTRSRRPVTLVYSETLTDKSAAMRREIAIKRMSAAAKRQLVSVPPDYTDAGTPVGG
jgi:predicted GIY-YIG superfamily endonuclease